MIPSSGKILEAYKALVSIHLIETEERSENEEEYHHHDDDAIGSRYFWRWTYPSIDSDARFFIEKRLAWHDAIINSRQHTHRSEFSFYKIRQLWIYILDRHGDRDPKSVFVLLTRDFYPRQYQRLLRLFSDLPCRSSVLLDTYLTLLITNRIYDGKLLSFDNNGSKLETDGQEPPTATLMSIVKLFSLDVILIYTAMLLKKRIVVYHHDNRHLIDFATALTDFVPHRPETRHIALVPNVDLHCPEQLADLRQRRYFIATFEDHKIEEHDDLYDVFVNLAAVEITVAHHAKDVFQMTKTHKDVAVSLVRAVEEKRATNIELINEVDKKTQELLQILKSMRANNDETQNENHRIFKEKLSSSPSLEQFFKNLALAEETKTTENIGI